MRSCSNGEALSAAAATDSWELSPPAKPAAAAAATAPFSCISCCCLIAAAAATCCPRASSCCSGGRVATRWVASIAAAAVPPPPAPRSAAAIAVAPASTCARCTAAARSRTPSARLVRSLRGTDAIASAASHAALACAATVSIFATPALRCFALTTAARQSWCRVNTSTSKSSSIGLPRNLTASNNASPRLASAGRRVRWMCLCVTSGLLISNTSPSTCAARHTGHV